MSATRSPGQADAIEGDAGLARDRGQELVDLAGIGVVREPRRQDQDTGQPAVAGQDRDQAIRLPGHKRAARLLALGRVRRHLAGSTSAAISARPRSSPYSTITVPKKAVKATVWNSASQSARPPSPVGREAPGALAAGGAGRWRAGSTCAPAGDRRRA